MKRFSFLCMILCVVCATQPVFICASVPKASVSAELSGNQVCLSLFFSSDVCSVRLNSMMSFFQDTVSDEVSDEKMRLHSWGIRVRIMPHLSVFAGNLSFSGIVDQIQNPSVYTGTAMRSFRLPVRGTAVSFVSAASQTDAPPFSLALQFESTAVQYTAVAVLPHVPHVLQNGVITEHLAVAPHALFTSLHFTVSRSLRFGFFAGSAPLSTKLPTTWFMSEPYVPEVSAPFVACQFVCDFKPFAFYVTGGVLKNTYGAIRFFVKSEAILRFSWLKVLTGISFIETDFVSFSNKRKQDIIRFYINPQIQFSLSQRRSLPQFSWGISAGAFLKQGEQYADKSFWRSFVKTEAAFISSAFSCSLFVSLPDIDITLYERSVLSCGLSIRFTPYCTIKSSIEWFFLASSDHMNPVWNCDLELNIPFLWSKTQLRASYAFASRLHTIQISHGFSKKIRLGKIYIEGVLKGGFEKKYKPNAVQEQNTLTTSGTVSLKVSM